MVLDGIPTDGFWASDFTLAEIKQLGAIQPIPERGQQFDGRFKIPTLEEVIDFVKRKSREKDRQIGIYPETKHPTYHQSIGLPLEDRLLRTLIASRLEPPPRAGDHPVVRDRQPEVPAPAHAAAAGATGRRQ